VLVGSNHDALRLSEHLLTQGLLVPAIRPPTVPQGTARLRISLSAAHDFADVQRLIDALAAAEKTWTAT
jgi:8-amino-7-oxononanoate synthase